jgi:hypothetical protein
VFSHRLAATFPDHGICLVKLQREAPRSHSAGCRTRRRCMRTSSPTIRTRWPICKNPAIRSRPPACSGCRARATRIRLKEPRPMKRTCPSC